MRLNRILITATVCIFAAAAIVGLTKWRRSLPPPAPARATPTVSILVIGIEGLEPSIVDRLVSEGRLPNLSILLKDGSATDFPSFPKGIDRRISWTSLVTGVSPERQGMGSMVESPRGGTTPAPLVPASRTVDTIWTLLSKSGSTVAVLGWPGTWPVEKVNGLVVAPYDTYLLERAHAGRSTDMVYPPQAYATVDSMFRDLTDMHRRDLARFVKEDSALGIETLIGENYDVLAGACAEAKTMLALARHAMSDPGASAIFVYLRGVDSVSQRFWHYAHPDIFANTRMPPQTRKFFEEQSEALGVTIERYYEYADELLGELLGLLAPGGTVAIIVDHGYAGIELDAQGSPMIGASMHSERGFLVLAGPSVASGVRATDASLLDVAPTVMAAAGIAIPADVEGTVLGQLLRQ